MNKGDEYSSRLKAERIVEEKIGFYIHFIVYVAVNSMFIFMWAYNDGVSSFPWFIFIAIPWGIGLIAHFIGTFMSHTYKEKMIKREMEKMKV